MKSDLSPTTDIALCASMAHKDKWLQVANYLQSRGLRVAMPDVTEHVAWSELTPEAITRQKGHYVRKHIAKIARSKAILVCNYEKNGVQNYIWGNTFLEMGAAFIYNLPIYLLNAIPRLPYTDELLALAPIVLEGDLSRIPTNI